MTSRPVVGAFVLGAPPPCEVSHYVAAPQAPTDLGKKIRLPPPRCGFYPPAITDASRHPLIDGRHGHCETAADTIPNEANPMPGGAAFQKVDRAPVGIRPPHA